MRGIRLIEKLKSTQVHAVGTPDSPSRNRVKGSKSKLTSSGSVAHAVLPGGLLKPELLEPQIDPFLKPVNLVESLAELYRRVDSCQGSDRSLLCIEQYAILRGLGDLKLLRRCLCAARQYAVDVHSKVVLSAWLRYERREDELVGVSAVECSGHVLECPVAALVSGHDPNSAFYQCQCGQSCYKVVGSAALEGTEYFDSEDCDVSFCINNVVVPCVRLKIAALSFPFKAMLYGGFRESRRDRIDLSRNGISAEGMQAVEVFSRTKRVEFFPPVLVLELLSFANRFCCEEMKSACDAYLASSVSGIEDALLLVDYGFDESAHLLVASCLQVFLRELPNSLYNHSVMKVFCSTASRERLSMLGRSAFLLYYLLVQVAMEEMLLSNTTIMLLERLQDFAVEKWQRALACHLLGCVLLERKEYKEARFYFEVAAQAGHVYSLAGVARAKYKQGQLYSAFRLMNSLIFEHKPLGWMYQERSLYGVGREKATDLITATELDPTLPFPYKYRAVMKAEQRQLREAVSEIDKIIRFKLSPDLLELRAWFYLALEDYGSALRDVRALLTLEPSFMMSHGKLSGNHMVELLSDQVPEWSVADCWMQLYERWSCVDDVGSLAVIHQMLVKDPGNSLLRFRQSLLLLRLNCQKAAMRCLRMARNSATAEHERLVYEGWMLYDTGYREEALSRAEKSIFIHRSFEAFFLKAYTLADTSLDPMASAYVIELLEEALRCPSDGLRKGQALNNLGSIYVDCGKLDQAANCYTNALDIRHTRAHQGLARVYHLRNQRKAAFDEMSKLVGKAYNSASAYEKRSEYCDRETAKDDLNMATKLDPTRTYPYRFRAAVLMDDGRVNEALEELSKAIAFKLDLQMLHLRAAFYESIGDLSSAIQDCEAALCLDSNHAELTDLYVRTKDRVAKESQFKLTSLHEY